MSHSRHIGVDAISNTDWSDDPLVRLGQMIDARNYLDIKIEEAVRDSRTTSRWQGSHVDHVPGRNTETQQVDEFSVASWQQVAEALGVTRQSAHRKYARLIED